MTQYIGIAETQTTNPAMTDLKQNGQTIPLFVACDDLDAMIVALDDWVSNFIGRMQPYRHELPTARPEEKVEQTPPADHSPIEQRIYGSRRRIAMIVRALDEMNEGLRL